MDLFGIWDVGLNRLTYNRQYGITNSGFVMRHAARFNLWKQSYNPDGSLIPHAQRQLRTIPYYAESSNGTFPPELFDTGAEIIRQWNSAVSGAVKDITAGRALPAAGQNIFVWCHNPVKLASDNAGAADDPACAVGLRPDLDSQGNPITDMAGNRILRARPGRSASLDDLLGQPGAGRRSRSATVRRCSTSRRVRRSPVRRTSTAPRSTRTRRVRATSSSS